jgi:3-phenylpropionate/trans-cinnamate dioxygenase ferredoxin component
VSTQGSTDGWVRTCRLADLGEDQPVHADIGQCPVCLVRTGGAVYALRDECTHQAVLLSEGEVIAKGAGKAGGVIECWLHGSRFDLGAGRAVSPPATRPVAVFAVRIDGGEVFVHLGDTGCEPAG